mgnify:CR=1 FL=1
MSGFHPLKTRIVFVPLSHCSRSPLGSRGFRCAVLRSNSPLGIFGKMLCTLGRWTRAFALLLPPKIVEVQTFRLEKGRAVLDVI